MNWYLAVLKNYAGFSSRARRKEFWMFTLIHLLILIGLSIVDVMLGLGNMEMGFGLLSGLYAIATFVPSLAVGARRLHDTDRSGWWQLLYLLPLLGAIVLIIFWCLDGTSDENRYGPSPKAGE